MLEKTINEIYFKGLQLNLEQLLYWEQELTENLQNGCTSILPALFIVNRIHDIAIYLEQLGNDADKIDWKDLYNKAKEKAIEQKKAESDAEENKK